MNLLKKITIILILTFSTLNFTNADSDINYDLEEIMKIIAENSNRNELIDNYSVDEIKSAVSKYNMLKYFADKVDIDSLENPKDYSSINEFIQIVAIFETKMKNDSKNSVYRNGVNTAKGYFQFINETYHRISDKIIEIEPEFPWSWNIYDYSYTGQAQFAITLWFRSAKYNNDLTSIKGLYRRDYASGLKVYCSYHHTDCDSQLSPGRYKELKKALEAWSKDLYFVDLDKKKKLKKEEDKILKKLKIKIKKTIKKVTKIIEKKIKEKTKKQETKSQKVKSEKSRKIEKEKEVKKSQRINKDSNNEDSEENTDTQNNNENSSPEDGTNANSENNDNENTESDEESHTDDTENNESSSDNEETNGDDNDDDEEVSGDNANNDEEADNNS